MKNEYNVRGKTTDKPVFLNVNNLLNIMMKKDEIVFTFIKIIIILIILVVIYKHERISPLSIILVLLPNQVKYVKTD